MLNNRRTCELAVHYNSSQHDISQINLIIIEQIKVGQWVYRLHSLKPDGLNESDFFFGHNREERGRK